MSCAPSPGDVPRHEEESVLVIGSGISVADCIKNGECLAARVA